MSERTVEPRNCKRKCRMFTKCYAASQSLVAWQQTEKKRANITIKQAAPESFFCFKEVAFIPQLKSLMWQIARFTAEPE